MTAAVGGPVLEAGTLGLACFAARFALSACGLEPELSVVASADPYGEEPVLRLAGTELAGTELIGTEVVGIGAILRWLATRGVGGGVNQADTATWLDVAQANRAAVTAARTAALTGAPDAAALRASAFQVLLELEDERTRQLLAGQQWFAGAEWGLADLALYPAVALSRDIGVDHQHLPALRTWLPRVRALAPGCRMPGIPDVW